MRRVVTFSLVFALAAATFAVGCGGTQQVDDTEENAADKTPRFRHGNLPYDDVEREAVGIDGRESEDQVYFRDADGRLLWTERDMNRDGRPDLFEYFDEQGELVEREFRLTFADEVTSIHYYRDGRLYRKELHTGFGKTHPIVEYYDGEGQLQRLERDSNLNGRIDVWEYYRDGRLVRTGRDTDGDGQPDTFDEFQ